MKVIKNTNLSNRNFKIDLIMRWLGHPINIMIVFFPKHRDAASFGINRIHRVISIGASGTRIAHKEADSAVIEIRIRPYNLLHVIKC